MKGKRVLFLVPAGILLLPLLAHLHRPQPPPKAQNVQTAPTYRPQSGPVPRFVTYHLAGVHLTRTKWPKGVDYNGKYDLKKNYSISDGHGPDGCEYILTLSPGPAWDSEKEELQKAFRGVRLQLVTGRGVAIGDTPQEVERKIGKPTSVMWVEGVADNQPYKKLRSYVYTYKGKRFYQAAYGFRKGKLAEISFRDANPPNKSTGPYGGCP